MLGMSGLVAADVLKLRRNVVTRHPHMHVAHGDFRLDQSERLGAPNGGGAIVDVELDEDVLGVSPHGVQRDVELTSDFGTGQLGSEQTNDAQLPFAERIRRAA